ncbi:MAG: hypothetical protein Q8R79_04205 [Legionellaceae bacterium]|nr:hypothetical protein [Legionellaceae bacterium]
MPDNNSISVERHQRNCATDFERLIRTLHAKPTPHIEIFQQQCDSIIQTLLTYLHEHPQNVLSDYSTLNLVEEPLTAAFFAEAIARYYSRNNIESPAGWWSQASYYHALFIMRNAEIFLIKQHWHQRIMECVKQFIEQDEALAQHNAEYFATENSYYTAVIFEALAQKNRAPHAYLYAAFYYMQLPSTLHVAHIKQCLSHYLQIHPTSNNRESVLQDICTVLAYENIHLLTEQLPLFMASLYNAYALKYLHIPSLVRELSQKAGDLYNLVPATYFLAKTCHFQAQHYGETHTQGFFAPRNNTQRALPTRKSHENHNGQHQPYLYSQHLPPASNTPSVRQRQHNPASSRISTDQPETASSHNGVW